MAIFISINKKYIPLRFLTRNSGFEYGIKCLHLCSETDYGDKEKYQNRHTTPSSFSLLLRHVTYTSCTTRHKKSISNLAPDSRMELSFPFLVQVLLKALKNSMFYKNPPRNPKTKQQTNKLHQRNK